MPQALTDFFIVRRTKTGTIQKDRTQIHAKVE